MAVDHRPTTSVIIPAYRASTLPECIDRVLAQDYTDSFEVVVCMSADDASELLSLPSDARLRVLTHVPRLSAAAARNRAVAASRGQLLAFTDADAMVDVDWLRQLVSASSDRLCVAGSVLNGTPGSAAGTVEYLVEFLDLHPARPARTLWHGATCNLLVPRDLWDLLGPFPEDLEGGEDTLLTVAARRLDRFVFAPDARVTHLNRTEWSRVFRHQVEFGRFTARLARRSAYKWRPLVRFTALAPIAFLGRIVSIFARAAAWSRGSFRGSLTVAPGVVVVLAGWGWGLATEGARLDWRGGRTSVVVGVAKREVPRS
jgi:glycosyltransferase involved in cell wall biosynthesis